MNRTVTSLLAIGLGAAAYQLAQRSDLINKRDIRKIGKRIVKNLI